MNRVRIASALAAASSLWGCAEHPVSTIGDAFDRWHDEQSQPLGTNRVDVLWVVDSSSSMVDEQNLIGQEFDGFIERLSQLGADVHLAAVSTDSEGGGVFSRAPGRVLAQNCRSAPPELQSCTPSPDGIIRSTDFFSSDVGAATPEQVEAMASAFKCVAQTGDCGSSIETGLDVMRDALDPAGAGGVQNAGFLRDDAYLVVIFLSDEDDCSGDGVATSDVACYSAGRNLTPIDNYLDTLIRAKARPGQDVTDPAERESILQRIFVAGIIGPDAGPLPVDGRDNPVACIQERPSEGSGEGPTVSRGYDGKRYRELIAAFGNRGIEQNICAGNYSGALQSIGDVIARNLNLHCLADPPLTCERDSDCPSGEACINPGADTIRPKVCSGFELAVSLAAPGEATYSTLVSPGPAELFEDESASIPPVRSPRNPVVRGLCEFLRSGGDVGIAPTCRESDYPTSHGA
jgi:hypothetical protein